MQSKDEAIKYWRQKHRTDVAHLKRENELMHKENDKLAEKN